MSGERKLVPMPLAAAIQARSDLVQCSLEHMSESGWAEIEGQVRRTPLMRAILKPLVHDEIAYDET